MKLRGFKVVSAFEHKGINIPKRATMNAAGYDIESAEDVTIQPNEIKLVATGLKAYMQDDEVLYLYDRSSNPRKKGIVLTNSVGVVDADYFNNPTNEGHFFGQFTNITDGPIEIKKGDKIMQGVFSKYLKADDDEAINAREGGFGSTDNEGE
ncbi:deoxyuridine 5'-triphosphate nucleotidohydrolase [Floricoccus tropicus]|uniref:dUTP diphosphatase n=1 Tax=Floricoccus tropicus TaxID=1859473 RepID=A0A1E8GMS4_9LACT|nr:deoxyuridine 5'-triphosphate nucleotidohydrolase [Floricoccus tropicus]OFI49545.1 deoxyuridine 5'-triphosphate nucleotidohydrolase [Floricoccus tropicus]